MTRYEKKNGQKKSLEYFSKTLRQTLDNTLVKTGTMLKWLFHILGGGRCRGSLKKFAECLKKMVRSLFLTSEHQKKIYQNKIFKVKKNNFAK